MNISDQIAIVVRDARWAHKRMKICIRHRHFSWKQWRDERNSLMARARRLKQELARDMEAGGPFPIADSAA